MNTPTELRLVAEVRIGALRMEAAEAVRDGQAGPLTFTSCYDNDVRAYMGENEARMFSRFVQDTIARRDIASEHKGGVTVPASVDGSPEGGDGEAGSIGEADDSAVPAQQGDAQ